MLSSPVKRKVMKFKVVLPSVTVLIRLPARMSLLIPVSTEPTAVANISRSYMLHLTNFIVVQLNGWNCLPSPKANDLVYYNNVKFIMKANVMVRNVVLNVYGMSVNERLTKAKHSGEYVTLLTVSMLVMTTVRVSTRGTLAVGRLTIGPTLPEATCYLP